MRVFKTKANDYKEFDGMEITEVINELGDNERDREVGRMFRIRLSNNKIIDAYQDEIALM
jgi:hypothetical protein